MLQQSLMYTLHGTEQRSQTADSLPQKYAQFNFTNA